MLANNEHYWTNSTRLSDPLAEEKEDDEGSSLVDGLFKVAKSTRKGKLANQIESSVLPLDVSDFNQEDIDKVGTRSTHLN